VGAWPNRRCVRAFQEEEEEMAAFERLVMGSILAFASVFLALPARAIVMEWVAVGDPGNGGDTALMKQDQSSGYGAVAYSYQGPNGRQYAGFVQRVDEHRRQLGGDFV
jgi:hypothetical protein